MAAWPGCLACQQLVWCPGPSLCARVNACAYELCVACAEMHQAITGREINFRPVNWATATGRNHKQWPAGRRPSRVHCMSMGEGMRIDTNSILQINTSSFTVHVFMYVIQDSSHQSWLQIRRLEVYSSNVQLGTSSMFHFTWA